MSADEHIGRDDQQEAERNTWEAQAWVYFIWIVLADRVYCKICYTKHPGTRLSQLQTGFPEEPFRMQFIPCLSAQQAKLFEKMFHTHLKLFRSSRE